LRRETTRMTRISSSRTRSVCHPAASSCPMSMDAKVATPDELKAQASELARDATKIIAQEANVIGKRGMEVAAVKVSEAADYVEEKGHEVAADERYPVEVAQVDNVTEGMRKTASYLKTNDPSGVVADVDGLIREHPYRAIAAGLVVGWIIGRITK
jgi:ElaB/YqjD/DUF883 family membrane-anchored ribosome-binding protein